MVFIRLKRVFLRNRVTQVAGWITLRGHRDRATPGLATACECVNLGSCQMLWRLALTVRHLRKTNESCSNCSQGFVSTGEVRRDSTVSCICMRVRSTRCFRRSFVSRPFSPLSLCPVAVRRVSVRVITVLCKFQLSAWNAFAGRATEALLKRCATNQSAFAEDGA